ncbi:MAG: BON domain-containing protein [Labilithrix sp.]|nr:BON domain-containing protein [Labilithrix sp.]MCW5815589.1 BON domain-containing protein [Labilithrix sp.]
MTKTKTILLSLLSLVGGCTFSDASLLPIAKGAPHTNVASEQTLTSSNAPLTASVSPQGRGRRDERRISDRVRAAIIADPALNQMALFRVRIETEGNKVILAGIVNSQAQETALLERVKGVEGVEGVDDQIEVLPSF